MELIILITGICLGLLVGVASINNSKQEQIKELNNLLMEIKNNHD